MNCPVCTNEKGEVKYLINGFSIIQCINCTHLFTDFKPSVQEVDEIYSDDYFFKGGAGYNDYTSEKELLIKRGEYYADKVSKHINPGLVLDIGSAAGFILKGFENKGWKGIGIEPNKSMVDYGREYLGVNQLRGTIETVELNEKFDLIILVQVVAHLYDINSSMNKICSLLNPGGLLLIETWNKDSWTAKFFGKYWHEYVPPSTLNYFSKKTLNLFMKQRKYVLVDEGTPKKKILTKHAKSIVKHKLEGKRSLGWLMFLFKIIPENIILTYPSEDLFWALYKLSK